MRLYETTFIINPQTDDATIDRQVQSVSALITTHGGKIIREDRIGTRRMAYPIAGLGQGYYASFIYEAPVETLPELERLFKIEDAYIRYLTVIYEGDPNAEPAQRDAFARTFEESDERGRDGRERRGYRGDRDRGDRDDRYEDRPRRGGGGGGGRHFGGDQSIARQEAGPARTASVPEEAAEVSDKRGKRRDEEEL